MDRRSFLLASAAATAFAGRATARGEFPKIDVYKSPTCGCCSGWIEHVRNAGFDVTARDVEQDELWALKERSGIVSNIGACHTAFVDGYVIEGHVPAGDVKRMLAERPDALGLAVPGMPIGSPGMDMDNRRDAFDTLLVLRNGITKLFERHA